MKTPTQRSKYGANNHVSQYILLSSCCVNKVGLERTSKTTFSVSEYRKYKCEYSRFARHSMLIRGPCIASPLLLLTAIKAVKALLTPDWILNSSTFFFISSSRSPLSSLASISRERIRVRAANMWTVNLQTGRKKKYSWDSSYTIILIMFNNMTTMTYSQLAPSTNNAYKQILV